MSAVSVSHSHGSPTRWMPDSPRRKPVATATTPPAAAAATAAVAMKSTMTTSTNNHPHTTTSNRMAMAGSKTLKVEREDDPAAGGSAALAANGEESGDVNVSVDVDVDVVNAGNGSRISFAPGTTFHDRARLRSRGGSQKVPATFNLRPLTSEDKTPRRRFKLPKATLPTLHYLSVSQEDFMDPRYAEDIVKTYGIPRYFFKSKSNLLMSSASKRRLSQKPAEGGGSVGTHCGQWTAATSEDVKKHMAALENEAEDPRPRTSDSSFVPRLSQRLPIVVPIATTSPDLRSQSVLARDLGESDKDGGSGVASKTQLPHMAPLYKPLIGEKYTHARFFPPMNPYRSLQMESEVTKYVEHKKRVGLGRYVRFAEPDNLPTSALLREATMYDLNHQGPAERPLDQFLPPPERKPFLRQRPRDPKNDPPARPSDDRDLVIMPKERTATEKSTAAVKDMMKR